MSKMSKEEFARRTKRVQQEALKSVAKTEQLNIRMDQVNISRLYELAKAKRKPVGTMVREWIVEKLEAESKSPNSEAPQNLKRALEQMIILLDEETKRRA